MTQLVYTQQGKRESEASQTEQYVFDTRPRIRDALDQIPD